jgi:hypothetical protein
VRLSNTLSDFYFYKQLNSSNFANLQYLQTYFGGGYAAWMQGYAPREGGWDTGVGRSSSI